MRSVISALRNIGLVAVTTLGLVAVVVTPADASPSLTATTAVVTTETLAIGTPADANAASLSRVVYSHQPASSQSGHANAVRSTYAEGGGYWRHVSTYPPLICNAIAAIYYWGRPYRCDFWWGLFQLYIWEPSA